MKWAIGAAILLAAALAPAHAWAAAVSVVNGASTYQASSALAPTVRDLNPIPGTSVRAFFPRFSATIATHGAPLRLRSLHLYVDGKDVTPMAAIASGAISYVPHEHLKSGWHDVFLQGSDTANRTFSQAWVFRSESPDVDMSMNADDGFAFAPVGVGGPFLHFFLISPFDGFGSLQLCGLSAPFTRAGGTPVFFVTVPVTLGTALLGCNPGALFTPFGLGVVQPNPFFFPIAIAGPGIFRSTPGGHPVIPMSGMTRSPYAAPVRGVTTMPVYRVPGMPVYRAPVLPVYPMRAPTSVPVMGVPAMGVPVIHAPVSGHPAAPVMPVVIPQPSIPH